MNGGTLFGLAIALGACLLFQIQFLLAKLILPWFGGSPSVWSTSLVVFQVLLLTGYAYAHALARLPRRAQVLRHGAVIGIVLLLLAWRAVAWPSPVTPGDAWKPDPDGSPVMQILLLLTGAIGLPFLLLASTSPLLQRWHADRMPGRSPYRLYALSNLGSLIGLVSYPWLVEPHLDVFQQGRWWAAAYVVFAGAVLVCARAMWHVAPIAAAETHGIDDAIMGAAGLEEPSLSLATAGSPALARPSAIDATVWLCLAAVPAALLQATTSRITQDIAAAPFLWMVPLAVYLVTFIVAFEYPRLYHRGVLTVLVALGMAAAIPEWSTKLTLAATLGELALVGWCLHGELAARAPAPAWLTRYFLLVSAGGAIGSAVVALGAPVLFDGLVEYPLTLMAAALVLGAVHVLRAEQIVSPTAARLSRVLGVMLAILGGVVGGKTLLGWADLTSDAIFTSRSFFGALRVREQEYDTGERYRRLQHGTTLHGLQYLAGDKASMATTYYTTSSGVGQALSGLSVLQRPARVGVVGLGVGTLAAYGRPGDRFTFFEIDPQVVALSTAPTPLFRYLRDSKATIEIVGGDARLSLERARPYGFDVLAVDAFSSDSVPVHLLTQEAFALYARHLRGSRSVLAVHVSNRYLELEDIVQAAGATSGFTTVEAVNDIESNDSERSTWMLLARDPAALAPFGAPRVGTPTTPWTDASSNLLQVLRW
jgi:spermidine synthase